MPMFNDYAIELQRKLHLQGIVIDTDLDDGCVVIDREIEQKISAWKKLL